MGAFSLIVVINLLNRGYLDYNHCTTMARGHQKALSQQKNAEQKAKMAKSKGSDGKKSAQAALHYKCCVCMIQLGDVKTYKQHFESKHPKLPLPADCCVE